MSKNFRDNYFLYCLYNNNNATHNTLTMYTQQIRKKYATSTSKIIINFDMPTPVLPIHSLTKFYSKLKKVLMKLKYHFYLIGAPVQLLVSSTYFLFAHFFKNFNSCLSFLMSPFTLLIIIFFIFEQKIII